ncbi:hypothetical protein M4951_12375 [Blastopirellula sp. J2-11]|uniref:hypothetical protein n=1 Tax=Blastopirellula sp. J2-11 TaxID=2943192 RepID=UPI0021CAAE89|nr:hypothetical protein [Blastopirellula sp. J2-11]UUO09081.1 hypothetical protein M4951_12375 [Blastopirellula sp. J2-11]
MAWSAGGLVGGLAGDFSSGALTAAKFGTQRALMSGIVKIGPDLVGAGAGAIAGYAIDGTTAGTLHGAMLGMMVGGIAGGLIGRLRGSALSPRSVNGPFGARGQGLIGLVQPGGTVDDSLKEVYLAIARSPEMAKAIRRYNRIAGRLGQKHSVGVDDIVTALENDVTFARTEHIFSGLFPFGREGYVVYARNRVVVPKKYWLQGTPTTAYGRRAGRHELLHLGASLNGQGDEYLHEFAVQAASTPENLVIGGAALGGIFSYGFYRWINE